MRQQGIPGPNVVNGKSEFPFPVPVEILSILALVPCSRSAIGFDFGFAFGFFLRMESLELCKILLPTGAQPQTRRPLTL